MKKLFLLIAVIYLAPITKVFAGDDMDSIRRKIAVCANDTVRAGLFNQIAMHYMKYDTLSSKRQRQIFQENALNYTIEAIHQYSRYNDTLGLRSCYDNLTKVYHDQKKYPQAKWFILQSNSLSRALKDNPAIIQSLIVLAGIKIEIKDYSLATRDLNEAMVIATKNHYAKQASDVQLGYAMLYSHMGNYTAANLALKKHVDMDDSIRKNEEAKLVAATVVQDSVQLQKKKSPIASSKRVSKASSYRKTASL